LRHTRLPHNEVGICFTMFPSVVAPPLAPPSSLVDIVPPGVVNPDAVRKLLSRAREVGYVIRVYRCNRYIPYEVVAFFSHLVWLLSQNNLFNRSNYNTCTVTHTSFQFRGVQCCPGGSPPVPVRPNHPSNHVRHQRQLCGKINCLQGSEESW